MPITWRMAAPCENCPFNAKGAGLHLRKTLHKGRWGEILKALRSDKHFTCHKTTEETGNGSNLMCAGAIQWQTKRGLSSNLQRTMERVEAFLSQTKR